MKFFSAVPSGNFWLLDTMKVDDTDVDDRTFTEGGFYGGDHPVRVLVGSSGRESEFNLTTCGALVASWRIGALIARYEPRDVQRIPAIVDGSDERFEILNVLNPLAALDERNSEFSRWNFANRPDLSGTYRYIEQLVLDPRKIPSYRHVFRIDGWPHVVFFSAVLAHEIERIQNRAVEFEPAEASAILRANTV